ncbi:ankyrin repeat domain-containing protein SOWAHD [Peromyscus californicus insignis]|uniref:ankyrin repeat domain-containing protein SOWAHD n=1 Tax=Peromyscus californicus insignis TaxID=564181 RepID=UPI0022A752E5|nr:ankyrin repeat domain-containing protein SOWAHD [Peromyscus californicus insignis]
MAQPQGDANPLPKSSDEPAKLNAPRAVRIRSYRTDVCSLGRYKGQAVADSATLSREPIFHSTLSVSGASGTRRRGALRELLGLQGAAPAGCLSEERLEPASPGSRRSSGQGSSRVCLEPREHAWILAAAEGRFEVLLELLEAEPSLLMQDDPITGYSVLHWLAKHGRHEELIWLHDFAQRRGLPLDVSAPGSGGLTPLHLAALQGHDMVIKVLVGALGADPTRRDHSGHRPCHYLRPGASWSLRELSGAEEWEMARDKEHDNANNNSTTSTGWSLRHTPSAPRSKSIGTHCKEMAQPAKEKKAPGNQRGQSNGFLRHLFPFIQYR